MPNQKKVQIVDELKKTLSGAKSVVLTDYHGLTVADLEKLRKEIASPGVYFRIVKNTLLEIALRDTPFKVETGSLSGPTALVLSSQDELGVLKKLFGFAQTHEKLAVKRGFIESIWYAGERLKELAGLPGKDVLISRLMGVLQSPLVRLVTAAKADQRKLVVILSSRR